MRSAEHAANEEGSQVGADADTDTESDTETDRDCLELYSLNPLSEMYSLFVSCSPLWGTNTIDAASQRILYVHSVRSFRPRGPLASTSVTRSDTDTELSMFPLVFAHARAC